MTFDELENRLEEVGKENFIAYKEINELKAKLDVAIKILDFLNYNHKFNSDCKCCDNNYPIFLEMLTALERIRG